MKPLIALSILFTFCSCNNQEEPTVDKSQMQSPIKEGCNKEQAEQAARSVFSEGKSGLIIVLSDLSAVHVPYDNELLPKELSSLEGNSILDYYEVVNESLIPAECKLNDGEVSFTYAMEFNNEILRLSQ